MVPAQYIIDIDDQEREAYATRQVMESPVLREQVAGALGLDDFSWYILSLDTQWTGMKPGDIDVLGGRLSWRDPADVLRARQECERERPDAHPSWFDLLAAKRIAEADGISWPPSTDYLAAVEVKCSYCENGIARSTKASPNKMKTIRDQVAGLFAYGLNRVALFDIVAGAPAGGEDSRAWFLAAQNATISLNAVREVIAARLPSNSPAGQLVWPVAAVAGGSEAFRGAGIPQVVRMPQDNPLIGNPDAKSTREALAARVLKMLSGLPQPRSFPIVLINCTRCKRLHQPQWSCSKAGSE